MPRPSVGRIVHYVSHGTPIRSDGTQAYTQQCRAAIITEVTADSDRVGLCVTNPTGLFFHSLTGGGSEYHDGAGNEGSPDCSMRSAHGDPFRYCACGWTEDSYRGGSWHWPVGD